MQGNIKESIIYCLFRIAVSILAFFLWLYPHSALADPDPALEQQVLQILRQHPEVIIESLQDYQQQQQKKRQQTRQELLDTLKTKPQTLIGQSPKTSNPENHAILLEFSDFQCPFCAQAHETVQQLLTDYPDQITLVYKHLPLISIHPQAILAAQSAYAAQQQGKFWEYHDALFEHQDQLSEDFFLETARNLDLDMVQFTADRAHSMEAIDADIQLAESLGIQGTPYFFFQGKMLSGAVPYEQFVTLLNQS